LSANYNNKETLDEEATGESEMGEYAEMLWLGPKRNERGPFKRNERIRVKRQLWNFCKCELWAR
jgi:hypothetical protein